MTRIRLVHSPLPRKSHAIQISADWNRYTYIWLVYMLGWEPDAANRVIATMAGLQAAANKAAAQAGGKR